MICSDIWIERIIDQVIAIPYGLAVYGMIWILIVRVLNPWEDNSASYSSSKMVLTEHFLDDRNFSALPLSHSPARRHMKDWSRSVFRLFWLVLPLTV